MKTFRVMQFNMQFGQQWDERDPDKAPICIANTLAEIKRYEPDIVLLQEVEHSVAVGSRPPFSPNYTQLRGGLPAYDSVFALPDPDPRELPFGVGLAIFSRQVLNGFSRHRLPSPPIPFTFEGKQTTPTDRLLITASTAVLGRTLRLFNVHLLAFFMLNTSSREHPEQRLKVLELLAGCEGPHLIGGDFNSSDHGALIEQFAAENLSAVNRGEVSWRRRPYVLDHLFHSPDLCCVKHEVCPTSTSDHHILLADFGFI